jgi:hypothetical protein
MVQLNCLSIEGIFKILTKLLIEFRYHFSTVLNSKMYYFILHYFSIRNNIVSY